MSETLGILGCIQGQHSLVAQGKLILIANSGSFSGGTDWTVNISESWSYALLWVGNIGGAIPVCPNVLTPNMTRYALLTFTISTNGTLSTLERMSATTTESYITIHNNMGNSYSISGGHLCVYSVA